MVKDRQTIMSAVQMPQQPREILLKLMSKKVTALAWDYIKDEDGFFPVVSAMGEIAGTTSILIAAELLSNSSGGLGDMLGGIGGVAPTEVVIIGAGTVGEYAARAALGLGAGVKIFDNFTYRLRRIQNDIGVRLFTSTLQPKVLLKALKRADVAVGAIRAPHGRTPCIVTQSMVEEMKQGSVIVDVSIDRGGCFETSHITTHTDPVFTHRGVRHYCVPNMASKVSRTASKALSNIVAPILLNIANDGGMETVLHQHPGMRNGVYVYHGTLTNAYLGKHLDIPHQNIDLLLAAF